LPSSALLQARAEPPGTLPVTASVHQDLHRLIEAVADRSHSHRSRLQE
jgi:hypothetical protein